MPNCLDTFESRQRPVRQCDEGGRDNGNRSIGNSGTGRKAIQPNEPSHAARDRDPHRPSIRGPAQSKIGEHTGCEGGRQAKVGAPDPSSTSGSATRAHSRDTNSVEWRTLSCIPGTHQALKLVAQLRGLRDLRSRLHLTLTARSADSFHCAVHSFSSSARLEPMRARLSSFKHCLPDMGKQRYFR